MLYYTVLHSLTIPHAHPTVQHHCMIIIESACSGSTTINEVWVTHKLGSFKSIHKPLFFLFFYYVQATPKVKIKNIQRYVWVHTCVFQFYRVHQIICNAFCIFCSTKPNEFQIEMLNYGVHLWFLFFSFFFFLANWIHLEKLVIPG